MGFKQFTDAILTVGKYATLNKLQEALIEKQTIGYFETNNTKSVKQEKKE